MKLDSCQGGKADETRLLFLPTLVYWHFQPTQSGKADETSNVFNSSEGVLKSLLALSTHPRREG
ncbi:hypothetical protein NDA03_06050 [Trichocoleus sp. Lan]|uniref:hypothetical protein n=1 Tax=Trichocoleus sp. Lan TaxID=2933927 RepID=UPI0032997C9A